MNTYYIMSHYEKNRIKKKIAHLLLDKFYQKPKLKVDDLRTLTTLEYDEEYTNLILKCIHA